MHQGLFFLRGQGRGGVPEIRFVRPAYLSNIFAKEALQ